MVVGGGRWWLKSGLLWLTLSCLSLSTENAEKLPYGGLAAVSPFVLRGLRLRAIAARAPAFPKRADSSRAGRGCLLVSRLQTPPCGMACRSARYPAYRMKAPDGPLGWPTAAGPLPSPEYVAASASLCYTPSLRHLPSFLTI